IVVDLPGAPGGPGGQEALARIGDGIAGFEGVAAVQPARLNDAGDTAVMSVVPETGPAAPETDDLVHGLRHEIRDRLEAETGARYVVAGSTAANIDISDKVGGALVPFMALVIGLTVVLLTAV